MQRSTTERLLAITLSVCLVGLLGGCSNAPKDTPDLGEVTGKVTLEGQPLPNATIVFQPDTGRMSMGVTNDQGKYELEYSSSSKGAKVGKHRMTITSYQPASSDEGTPAVPEKVPADYNVRAFNNPEMTREVKSGSNKINFELKAGEVIQPQAEEGTEGAAVSKGRRGTK